MENIQMSFYKKILIKLLYIYESRKFVFDYFYKRYKNLFSKSYSCVLNISKQNLYIYFRLGKLNQAAQNVFRTCSENLANVMLLFTIA